jgi:HAD superfamily hydrolase (TIGR01458 family)
MDEGTPALLPVRALLIDVDGVLRIDDEPIPGAAAALAALRARGFGLRFVTNTSVRSRHGLAQNLQAIGLPIREAELFTAPVATAAYLRRARRRRLFLLVKGDVGEDFAEFDRVTSAADAVVVGGAEEEFTYANVNLAFQLVVAGAELVAIHRDGAWQTTRGLQLDAGAYVAAIEYATGVRATLIGKPSPALFQLALADLGCPPEAALVVGDGLRSDIGGGQAIGARTVLVRTGRFRPADLTGEIRPDRIVASIATLPDHLYYQSEEG